MLLYKNARDTTVTETLQKKIHKPVISTKNVDIKMDIMLVFVFSTAIWDRFGQYLLFFHLSYWPVLYTANLQLAAE